MFSTTTAADWEIRAQNLFISDHIDSLDDADGDGTQMDIFNLAHSFQITLDLF